MQKTFFTIALFLGFYVANATTGDSIVIKCVTKWKSRSDFNLTIKEIPKDFDRSKLISTTTRLNDSTWLLKMPPLTKEKNFCPYQLMINGTTYPVFLTKNVHNTIIYIDTCIDKLHPYKISATQNDELGFCIELENYRNQINWASLKQMTDTIKIAEKINTISNEINELKKKYHTLIIKDEAFASFVNIEILRLLHAILPDSYKNCLAGRQFLDSLSKECDILIHQPSIITSRNSTIIGKNFLQKKIANNISNYNDTNFTKVVDKEISTLPTGLFKDCMIESLFRTYTYQKEICPQNIQNMFVYAKNRIKDNNVLQALKEDYQLYINENQLLPEEILVNTKLINPEGKTVSLKDALNKWQKEGKEKVLIDFWASWCGPCKSEIGATSSFIDNLKKQDKSFEYIYLSIDVPEKYAAAKQFAAQNKIQNQLYYLVKSNQSAFFKYFGIDGIPYHVLLNIKSKKFLSHTIAPGLHEEFIQLIGKAL